MRSVIALPQVLVEVDGSELEEAAINELTAVRVRHRLAAPAQCELTFHGPVETDLPEAGTELRVAVAGHETCLFGTTRSSSARTTHCIDSASVRAHAHWCR